eukprot:GEZU01017609.1.p1 GENE.GEZU01017609.1~~GEZU01017609.1.p1  ORF type:complete len:184 (+),score=42.71 GEZU01017609.1:109-660(+)
MLLRKSYASTLRYVFASSSPSAFIRHASTITTTTTTNALASTTNRSRILTTSAYSRRQYAVSAGASGQDDKLQPQQPSPPQQPPEEKTIPGFNVDEKLEEPASSDENGQIPKSFYQTTRFGQEDEKKKGAGPFLAIAACLLASAFVFITTIHQTAKNKERHKFDEQFQAMKEEVLAQRPRRRE